jgi:5-methylcytosine-specific restriction endonuclease McrA
MENHKMLWNKESDKLKSLRSSAEWQRLRQKVLFDQNGLCRLCSRMATEVHHLELANESNFFVRENLVGLCVKCHKKVHNAYKLGIKWEDIIWRA